MPPAEPARSAPSVIGRARLVTTRAPRDPAGVVIVLHGGAARHDGMTVSPTQLSVLRMIPTARRVARAGRGRLAVYRLLNSARGWSSDHTPVEDVRWAIGELRARHPTLPPVALVGHSLGGRAALLAGGQPEVRAVVALAPWVYPTDDADLSGRQVLIVHGSQDRIADPDRAQAVARSLRRHTQVCVVMVTGGKHAMLARHGVFDGLAADFAAAALLGTPADGVVADALAGVDDLTV